MSTKSTSISFRIGIENRAQLEERAKASGSKVSELARNMVLQALDDESELARLRIKVDSLEDSIVSLREDFAVAIKALLVVTSSDTVISPEDADTWVEKNLRSLR